MYRHIFNVPSFTHIRNREKLDCPDQSLAQIQVGNSINKKQNFATVLHAQYTNSTNSLIHVDQQILAITPALQLQRVITVALSCGYINQATLSKQVQLL